MDISDAFVMIEYDVTPAGDMPLGEAVDTYYLLKDIADKAERLRKLYAQYIFNNAGEISSVSGEEIDVGYSIIETTRYSLDTDVVKTSDDVAYVIEQIGDDGDRMLKMKPALDTKAFAAWVRKHKDNNIDGIKVSTSKQLRKQILTH